jgi:DNA (cytosine-5)-methyltransferase 1
VANNFQRFLRGVIEGRYTPDSHRFIHHTTRAEMVFTRLLASAHRNRRIAGIERKVFGLRKRSVTVLSPDEPAPTVTTIPDDFIHYSEPRVMTVRECARLQTFPEWVEFRGPYTTGGMRRKSEVPRYTQVGNAVPPLFAEQLGRAMREVLVTIKLIQ